MAQDLYDVLQVPDNANDIWIRRAYDQKRKSIEGDASLSAENKQAALVMVEKVFNVLSNPVSRERYDNRHAPAGGNIATAGGMPFWVWGAAAVFVLVAVAMYWQHSRAKEQLRLEQERITAEQTARLREIEARERAQSDAARLVETALSQQNSQSQANRDERGQRYQDALRERELAQMRNDQRQLESADRQATYNAQAQERREQAAQQADMRRAQAEVERQKRFLEQSDRERQNAANQQAAQAARDQYKQQLEDRRNRVGLPSR